MSGYTIAHIEPRGLIDRYGIISQSLLEVKMTRVQMFVNVWCFKQQKRWNLLSSFENFLPILWNMMDDV